METAADRIAMLRALGETFIWKGVEIIGVFELPFENTLGMDGGRPSLITEATLIDGIALSDTLTRQLDSADYTLRAQEPDGFGMVRLVLEEK